MAKRRDRSRWAHTASILAMLFNCNRGENDSPATPDDFDPYAEPKEKISITAAALGQMLMR